MTADSKESALSRWSRRKAEVLAEKDAATAAPEPAEAAASVLVEPEEEPLLTDADMPDIDSLTEESDFSPFMSPGVSDELRNLALRKLFRAPVFNLRDGLDEYDDDFTTFEKLGGIVTADMKHQLEMQQQKLRDKLAADGETEALEADLDGIEDDLAEEIEHDDEAAPAIAQAEAGESRCREETGNG